MTDKEKTSIDTAINQIYQCIIDSKNPNNATKRGGDYRIGLRKAIDILENLKQMNQKEIAKAFDDGDYNYHYSRKTGNDFEDGQEYYEELYG
jgi:hypothetical protein